ncbi:MAG TPA: hypothetical protein VFA85_14815 [Terriglobales bacterium]|nr:hypothetical protein [Terriglobales bacterium]
MREEILKKFFLGEVSATELAADLSGSTKRLTKIVSNISIEDMEGQFVVTRPMLVLLCDAVLSGSLRAEELRTIGFALEASDHFEWDGDTDEITANVIADWACPEVNYPLTQENIRRFRTWLTNVEPYPSRPNQVVNYGGGVISVTQKKSIDRHQRRK